MCVCVDATWREGQAETPRGLQDPKHEVKRGPLGRTALLSPETHTQTKKFTGMLRNVSAHVKRGHRQFAHVDTHTVGSDGGSGAHMRKEDEHTHTLSALYITLGS